jgi:hypothetical protein
MLQKIYDSDPDTLSFIASGKLTDHEYQTMFIPGMENALLNANKINVLWKMEDFEGWEAHAAWDEMLLAIKTRNQIDRIALVGEQEWQQKLPRYLKPFTNAEVRYYDSQQFEDAKDWLTHLAGEKKATKATGP